MSGRFALAFAALLATGGCTVKIDDYLSRACDDAHICPAGRACVEGTCVDPVLGLDACPVLPAAETQLDGSWTDLVVNLAPTGHIGNTVPQLWYPDGANPGLLAFSDIDLPRTQAMLATSTDQGQTWTMAPAVSPAQPVAPTVAASVQTTEASLCPGNVCSGYIVNETPSVVYDPTDPDPTRAYKYMTLNHFRFLNGNNRADWGMVLLLTAPDPAGPWASEPLLGWPTTSPTFNNKGQKSFVFNIAGINDCVFLFYPDLTVTEFGLDMVVDCAYTESGVGAVQRTVLLRSTDHAGSFQFVSNLLTPDDVSCLDPNATGGFQYHSLVKLGDSYYLMVTGQAKDGTVLGCHTLPFDSMAEGKLSLHPSGRIADYRRITFPDQVVGGICTTAEAVKDRGYLMNTYDSKGDLPYFRLEWTGTPAP